MVELLINLKKVFMSKHTIKFYPVDNGDTNLIKLKDKTTILVDCKIRNGDATLAGNSIYDVKADLLESLELRDKDHFLDLLILTHPDQDHCQGYSTHFYSGAPSKYGKTNRDNDEIIIDEMWVSSMLFNDVSNDDAKALKKEAERRRKLWKDNDTSKNDPGNRLRMVGYDGDNKFDKTPSITPGNFINEINGDEKLDFEFFVHGPFKESLIISNAESDKNSSSIILQARFKINASDNECSCYYLFGGDADHFRWEKVLEMSKNNNHEEELRWDLFLSPHHCSWTFFNDTPYKENKTAKKTSLEILDYKMNGAQIIASCKPIKNNDDNPPHYFAKEEYLKRVHKSKFIELAMNPKEKEPKPYIFEVTPQGPMKKKASVNSAIASAGGSSSAVNKKSEYGAKFI